MDKITIQTVISIIAAFISLSTVIVSIYYNQKNNKQYLKSLDPLLFFKLFELKDELYLRVTNTGRSAAKDVLIEIKKLENNGDRNELEKEGDELLRHKTKQIMAAAKRGKIKEMDGELMIMVMDYIKVFESGKLVIRFYDGTEFECETE